jgi:Concanavalin A-like lectin/glucanases superfamily
VEKKMNKLTQTLMIALLAIFPLFSQIPNSGLTHAYFMNGSGKDASGHGHDLWEMSRKDTTDRNSNLNSAVSLNGVNQAFRLPDSTLPCAGAPFTLSLWANNNSIGSTLVSWGAFTPGKYINIAIDPDGQYIHVITGTDTLKGRIHTPYNKYLAWIPVSVSYNGITTSIYIGDSLVKSGNIPLNIEKGGYLGIGCQFTSFTGLLDCILFYNKCMNKNEISYILNCSEKLNSAPILNHKAIDTITKGNTYTTIFSATDIDGQSLTYKLITGSTGMSLNSNVLSWSPNTSGTFEISVSVTDGLDTTILNYKVYVINPVSVVTKNIKLGTTHKNNKQELCYSINGRRMLSNIKISQINIKGNQRAINLRK